MSALRAILIDDEPLATRRLSATLADIGEVDIVGSSSNACRGVEMIDRLRPDVVFLDIAMPGLDGFDVVARMPQPDTPAVVFVTAYDNRAVDAFAIDAVDYLMKPVARDRLASSITRVRQWLGARDSGRDDTGAEAAPQFLADDSLWVHRHQEFVRVPIAKIAWLEAQGDYVQIHAKGGGGLLRATLNTLEAKLDPATFIRVHRSAICRRDAIIALKRKPTGALAVSLANGDWAPVGRTYGSGLRAMLKRLRGA
ncbi:LytR/AlgR family response regulator transcription factor [Allosphingosinicella indica]|uniref:Two component transcriptional regulator, LytTR family n=1 Tax=Allosphingosinicella indica TaxID=941907 RepID=A0A1X7GT45_9SPHN|nr:LytTR family DNA-binding domain-containing protein [Allosphingosinicella indica]SMF74348.1 two component transcriptional regulator, LytTR family [Allosphingosinicella indica]